MKLITTLLIASVIAASADESDIYRQMEIIRQAQAETEARYERKIDNERKCRELLDKKIEILDKKLKLLETLVLETLAH